MTSVSIANPVHEASATKTRACTTNSSPKGVDSVSTSEVWIANDGGTLQKFTSLSTGCTSTPYTVNGDPHFIDRSTSTQIEYTNHINNKITYFDPSTLTKIDCTDANISSPDDIDSDTASAQYSTSYNNGKLIKTVKGTPCTVTPFSLPLSGANPEGIDKSTDVGGFLVVDQANKKVYKFNTSTNSFTLCLTLANIPWFVADDSSQDIFYVTINDHVSGNNVDQVKIGGTLSCLVAETSPTAPGHPFDIAVKQNAAVVTFNDIPKVGIYSTTTHAWTFDDWSTECSGCIGFGIDTIYSTGDYYAALRGSISKIVKGTF
jgi:hypothetical protein